MLTTVKNILVLSTVGPFTTESKFSEEELNALCAQSSAIGRVLIRISYKGEKCIAAVGKTKPAAPMINPNHLVAIPCPPECPGGKYSFTPDC